MINWLNMGVRAGHGSGGTRFVRSRLVGVGQGVGWPFEGLPGGVGKVRVARSAPARDSAALTAPLAARAGWHERPRDRQLAVGLALAGFGPLAWEVRAVNWQLGRADVSVIGSLVGSGVRF